MILPLSSEDVLKKYIKFLTKIQITEIKQISIVYFLGNISFVSELESHNSETRSKRGSVLSTSNSMYKDGFPIYSVGDQINYRYEIIKFIS